MQCLLRLSLLTVLHQFWRAKRKARDGDGSMHGHGTTWRRYSATDIHIESLFVISWPSVRAMQKLTYSILFGSASPS